MRMADGPHGLRVQDEENPDHLGLGRSLPAMCFPPAVTVASSWDPVLVRQVGDALGREALSQGVDVVLGPGINIKRSPLCGRNFEYYSEDPLLAGRLATAMVVGLQSQGVAACVKHFAVNNQETDRLRVSADVDERHCGRSTFGPSRSWSGRLNRGP
jgi:beta-glucosidase